MILKERIVADMKEAMREKDSVRLETVRMLRAAIQRKELDDRTVLDDDAVLAVVQKMVKQCKDAATQFMEGDRPELAEKENANIKYLSLYLPEQLSDAEVDELIKQSIADTGASSMKDMGKVMGLLKSKVQGRADMGSLSGRIKALLS